MLRHGEERKAEARRQGKLRQKHLILQVCLCLTGGSPGYGGTGGLASSDFRARIGGAGSGGTSYVGSKGCNRYLMSVRGMWDLGSRGSSMRNEDGGCEDCGHGGAPMCREDGSASFGGAGDHQGSGREIVSSVCSPCRFSSTDGDSSQSSTTRSRGFKEPQVFI